MNEALSKSDPAAEKPGPFTRWIRREHRFIEELVLAGVLALILIGIAITNISPTRSYRFWFAMVVLFATAGLVLGAVRAHRKHISIPKVALDQVVHWAATFVAVVAVYWMLNAGRLTFEAAGLVILLLLGFAMFLDGYYRVGWRFSLLGLILGLMSVGAAYLSAYIWPILILGAVIWPLSIGVEIYLTHLGDKRRGAK